MEVLGPGVVDILYGITQFGDIGSIGIYLNPQRIDGLIGRKQLRSVHRISAIFIQTACGHVSDGAFCAYITNADRAYWSTTREGIGITINNRATSTYSKSCNGIIT